ncbi:MAG: hypothetical protein JO100_04410 [Pseudonocardia sp.]|nr:hypothetical protein [Pseudonocardia sp.]
MYPTDLAALIGAAASDVLAARGFDVGVLPAEIGLIRPREPARGDYSTPVALRASSRLGVPSRALAGWLADELASKDGIAAAEAVDPGFVNIRLSSADPCAASVDAARSPDERIPRGGMIFQVPADRIVRLRDGASMTVARLAELVGWDTARFVVLLASRIDLEALTTATDRNPAFRVRYAHARLCAIARNAARLNVQPGPAHGLEHPRERELITPLSEYPRIAQRATDHNEPHRLARHLLTIADAFGRFDQCCQVLPLGDEPPIDQHRARLALCAATRATLANGLCRLDVHAPERM